MEKIIKELRELYVYEWEGNQMADMDYMWKRSTDGAKSEKEIK